MLLFFFTFEGHFDVLTIERFPQFRQFETHHGLLYSVVDRALSSARCTAKESVG